MPKVQLIDRAGNGGSFGLAVAFFSAFFIFLIAGGAAPSENEDQTLVNTAPAGNTQCYGAPPFSGCVVEYKTRVDVTPYNQNVWVSMQLLRPTDTVTGRAALANTDLQYSYVYELDVDAIDKNGGRSVVVNNVTHLATMYCPRLPTAATPAKDVPCTFVANADTILFRPVTGAVFQQSFITAKAYDITIRMYDPLSGFTDTGLTNLDGTMTFVFKAYKVRRNNASLPISWEQVLQLQQASGSPKGSISRPGIARRGSIHDSFLSRDAVVTTRSILNHFPLLQC